MIQQITIRNVTIGEGMPKVIVPIVEKTKCAIVEKGAEIASMDVHMVEWRADFFEGVASVDRVLEALAELRRALPDKILLYTFRTVNEGGNTALALEDYIRINEAVAASGNADFVDVEVFTLGDLAEKHIAAVQSRGTLVIGSNHDFDKTPGKDEMVRRLVSIQSAGADIPKLAVMPRSKKDVLALLAATYEMHTQYAKRPIITMSMAPMGVLSRLSGEVFGSAMTFGAAGRVSAPGQIPVEQLSLGLSIIHNAC